MKRRIMYVELKTGFDDHDGPAFIGWVKFSKTRKTVFVHGRSLERIYGGGIANHVDLKTGELFWVTAPKKSGDDRHPSGTGNVVVDKNAAEEYERFKSS